MNDYYRYYKLKRRLDRAKKWEKKFIETEQEEILCDKVTQKLRKDAPITYYIVNFINIPTICLTFIKKLLLYQSYKKCKKEIELIQEEIKNYE
jgi:hypothetical protein